MFVICLAIAWINAVLSPGREDPPDFSPLTDDQFLVRCSPRTDPDVALRVRRMLSECLNVDYERIHPSHTLQRDLCAE